MMSTLVPLTFSSLLTSWRVPLILNANKPIRNTLLRPKGVSRHGYDVPSKSILLRISAKEK